MYRHVLYLQATRYTQNRCLSDWINQHTRTRLQVYRGLCRLIEKVPEYCTRVIVGDSIIELSLSVFISSVIMGDNIKIIEEDAFYYCQTLRFV